MVQERLTPHPYRIYDIRPVLVVQKVLLSLELTFAAHWDPFHHGWIPCCKGLVNFNGMCIAAGPGSIITHPNDLV